jgi:hypothetical protein
LGAAALKMLSHAVPAQTRPKATMQVISRALRGARVLEGERGEADGFADHLLQNVREGVRS